jgi:hypothetical protein
VQPSDKGRSGAAAKIRHSGLCAAGYFWLKTVIPKGASEPPHATTKAEGNLGVPAIAVSRQACQLLIPGLDPLVPFIHLNRVCHLEGAAGAVVIGQYLVLSQLFRLTGIGRLNMAAHHFHTQTATAQIRSEFSFPMRREAGAGYIQNVLIVALWHDVKGGKTHDEGQTVDLTTVRSERQSREINSGKLAEADRGAVFKLHLGKTVLCRGQGDSFLDGSVHSGAIPHRGSRPTREDRARDQTQAHHTGVRYIRGRWRLRIIWSGQNGRSQAERPKQKNAMKNKSLLAHKHLLAALVRPFRPQVRPLSLHSASYAATALDTTNLPLEKIPTSIAGLGWRRAIRPQSDRRPAAPRRYGVVDSRPVCFVLSAKASTARVFTHCSDCDVDLVEHLPGDSDTVPSDASLRQVWAGDDENMCVDICRELTAAAIPFHVNERSWQLFKGMEQAFQIRVPPDSYDQAKEIIDKGGYDVTADAEDQSVTELLAEDDGPASEEADDDWDPEKWHPEDATVEVWREKASENTSLVASALRENHIHTRTDALDDGSQKIFVLESDESRAREIVEEIKEGRPPA